MKTVTETVTSLYTRRELIWILVSKELKARYRGSTLGMLWTFLNPLLLLLVYALVFSVYMRIKVENYAVFVFVGLLPWICFSTSLTEGVNAITGSGSLITKSMFPSEILPMVKVLSNFANYIFSLPLLFFFIFLYGVPIGVGVLWLPVIVMAQLLFTTGIVYFISAVNVKFRDTQHIVANFLILWFFLCPILYPISQTPEEWRFTFYLNPMAVLTIEYQQILFNGGSPSLKSVFALGLLGIVTTIFGLYQFAKSRDSFAENI
ncbi:O-antigen export system permease protein RfbD [hydrothermal vent metagenome]|uniref:O-antigen export system permease protein RfbD n=1 Tax=hydrothermal vent metagenome TaxID=652676 RepID=A0A3B1BIQ5_9ZZZZ